MQASGRTARSSVSTKIMLAAALIAVIAFAITATITFLESRGALLPLSQRVMERTAQVGAAEIKAKLEVAMDTVTSSSRTMASLVEAGVTDREVGRAILKREMEANPDWLMIWMIWEPEAFDGKDAEWQGAPGHTSDGRYYVSFQRVNGQVSMEVAPLLNYNDPGDGDYYLVPKELKRPVVIEPYLYPVDGKDVLMTSITAPIMRDGQVLGIFGVDLALEGVRTMVDGIQAMDVGYARLLSPAGAVLGDRDASLVGKPLPGADVADLLARLGKGELAQRREANAVFNEIALEAYAPFKVGAAEETFALGVVVPEAYILRDARRLLWTVAGTGLIGAVLLCAVLFFALRRLVLNPLNAVVATSNDIAEGRLDRRIAQDRDDELGVLAGAMSRVQTQVKDFIAAQLQLAQEHDAGRMSQRIDASRYPGAFGEMAAAVNHLVDEQIKVNAQVMELLGRYAIGDLSQDMPALPGEKASITETMARAKSNLLAINADIQRLVAAAAHGDFSARGESARYQFAFREMVEGLNTLMREADAGLGDVGRVLSALAEGDLTARVERNYDGAFGVLASSANRTTQQIAQIARQIQQATDQINTAAAEIAAGNNDLAARTETQAASLEETASSMEELTSTVRQNTDSSVQALELANGAAKVAERGGTVVRNVVSTMDDISTSSKKIGDIISVIDGIAFQTNILALNAAVEAARAGEQGRGFAVVASEVRALAQRSADAAKEIKELIVASVRNVDTGAQLVADAGATMDEIVQAVARVSDIMGDITAASKEQAAGIEQVNQTITQMDQMTQQNAALVEQATAAARAMEQQADSLARSAAVFRL